MTFSAADLATFSDVVQDTNPVHQGDAPIVHAGLLIGLACAAPPITERCAARSFYCWSPAALAVSPRVLMRVARRAGLRPPHLPIRLEDYREAFFGTPPYTAGQRIIEDLEGMERP